MVKDGDNVFFKTKHGQIISGVLVRGVVYGKGKKKYRPPADKIFKTKQEARKSDWNPYTKGSRKDLERKVEIAKSKLPKFTPAEIQEQVIAGHRKFNPVASDLGRSNLDELLRLGDVSKRIQQAVNKRQAAIKIQSITRGDIQRRRLTTEGWGAIASPTHFGRFGEAGSSERAMWLGRAEEELYRPENIHALRLATREGGYQRYRKAPWEWELGALPRSPRGRDYRRIPGSVWYEGPYGEMETGLQDYPACPTDIARAHRGFVRSHKPTLRKLVRAGRREHYSQGRAVGVGGLVGGSRDPNTHRHEEARDWRRGPVEIVD